MATMNRIASQKEAPLSEDKVNELILQRNMSIKIEQEKKLSQHKQMIVQALQWETTNQQLKAICNYESHLMEEQQKLGNLNLDEPEKLDPNE